MADDIFEVKRRMQSVLFEIPGVNACATAYKTVAGRQTDTLAICVYVDEKRALEQVPPDERIPQEIEGHPTDVVQRGRAVPLLGGNSADAKRYRPLEGGSQINPKGLSIGTLGCLVRDKDSGDVMALTNQHVVKDDGRKVGQPKACCGDTIGSVQKVHKDDKVDAATISIGDEPWSASIVSLGDITGTHVITKDEYKNYFVQKRGCVTGSTEGEVFCIDYTSKNAVWIDQIAVRGKNFIDHGDSGSVLVNDKIEVVGLMRSKFVDDSGGLACQLDLTLAALNISILTEDDVPEAYRSLPRERFDYEALQADVEKELEGSKKGREFLAIYKANRPEVQELIETNKRVALVWHRNHGPDLLTMLRTAVQNAHEPTPTTIDGDPIANCLGNIAGILLEHGDAKLQNAILTNQEQALSYVGKSWQEVLSSLE